MKGQTKTIRSKRLAVDLENLNRLNPGSIFSFRKNAKSLEKELPLKIYEQYLHLHLPRFKLLKQPVLLPPLIEDHSNSLERYRSPKQQRSTRARYKTEEVALPPPTKDYSKYCQMSFRTQDKPTEKSHEASHLGSLNAPIDMTDIVKWEEEQGIREGTNDDVLKSSMMLNFRPIGKHHSQCQTPVKQLGTNSDNRQHFCTKSHTSRVATNQSMALRTEKPPLKLKRRHKPKVPEYSPWSTPADQQSLF